MKRVFEQYSGVAKVEMMTSRCNRAVLFEAINQNMLSVFLACNLVTGLVNLLMDTKESSTLVALLVLTGYAFLFSAGAFYLKLFNVTVRFT